MTADYGTIREENIARYGWDTAVLDLLGHLYSERTHFLFELMQNAEDAGATDLAFELFADRLEVRHDGRPFTEADVRGVCGVGKSGKSGDLTAIGKFGIGFKSVYAYTKTPRVYSAGERFRIERYVRPFPVEPIPVPQGQTLFVFPFDHDTVPAQAAVREISAALNEIQPRILLFLAGIGRLRVGGTGVRGSVIERRAEGRDGDGGRSGSGAGQGSGGGAGQGSGGGFSRLVTLSRGNSSETWLVWHRPVEDLRVEIAFRFDGGRVRRCGRSPLTVYFPTEKETTLGFVVQGPYRTTPARDNVPEHDPSNQALARQTAALLADVLRELRTAGLLTVEVLRALPLDAARLPGLFRPLFDSVREVLATEEILPAAGGGYRAAGELRLAGRADLAGLVSPDQLGALYGSDVIDGKLDRAGPRALYFADLDITEHSELWEYLRDEIGVGEVTPEDLVANLTGDFLRAQPDGWITRLYAFLMGYLRLARSRPVIRLADGSHVAPFDGRGRPAAYLPGSAATSLPTVRRAVADSPAARPFLEALGLSEPDLVAEVLDVILPRYRRMADIADLDQAQHDADLDCVVRALDEAPAGQRQELLDQLRQTAFLIGENAATGEQRLLPPPGLYQRTKDLEIYFDGNPGAWFAGDGYGPWLVQLRAMGVRHGVAVRAGTPNELGYVVIAAEFGRNERGVDGFDPGAEIDGLEFALRHPGHARSEYVWNVLLAPNRRLVAGVVERSVLASFANSTCEHQRSAIALAAEREAWLPGPDGRFAPPGELSLDDLPPTYAREEGLAQALGMRRPVVAEAARQLGIPAEILWGLRAHPDLVALVSRELAARRVSDPGSPGAGG